MSKRIEYLIVCGIVLLLGAQYALAGVCDPQGCAEHAKAACHADGSVVKSSDTETSGLVTPAKCKWTCETLIGTVEDHEIKCPRDKAGWPWPWGPKQAVMTIVDDPEPIAGRFVLPWVKEMLP